jgi:hypothetical protein
MAKRAAGSISDEAVKSKTGRVLREWYALADKAGGRRMTHGEIVAVLTRAGVPSWWRQMIAVSYERARGLREKHQTPQGYQMSASKTMGAPVDRLYRAWTDGRLRKRWLGDADFSVRKATANRALRLTWGKGGSVEVSFASKGIGRGQVVVGHTKLASAAAVERMKRWWSTRLAALDHMVAAQPVRARKAATRAKATPRLRRSKKR